ncbi:MAG: hypothetical protein V3T14_02155 [Myxococcota bacterium]
MKFNPSPGAFQFLVRTRNHSLDSEIETPMERLEVSLALGAQRLGLPSERAQAGQRAEMRLEPGASGAISGIAPRPYCKPVYLRGFPILRRIVCQGL